MDIWRNSDEDIGQDKPVPELFSLDGTSGLVALVRVGKREKPPEASNHFHSPFQPAAQFVGGAERV